MMRPCFLLLCFALPCSAQQAAPFAIAGHVVRHLDQRAVKGARVSLSMVKDRENQVSAISGDNGEFSFQGVPAGKYQLEVADHGTSQRYQQTDNFATDIVVGRGKDTEHIQFVLNAQATISGSVVDEDSDPVPRVMVHLYTRTLVSGRYQIRIRTQTNTDTDGTFHFRHLQPGTYFVCVVGQPWYSQGIMRMPHQPEDHSGLDMAYPVTYYAGATSPEGATPLSLEEGGKAEIQIALHAVPSLHIALEGVEMNAPRNVLSLMQAGPGGTIIRLPTMRVASELVGVAPGNYLLAGNPTGETQEISLTSNTSIRLADAVKTSISGKVNVEGQVPSGLEVIIRNPAAGRAFTATVKSDGTFEVARAISGKYTVVLANAPETSLERLEVKGAAFANGELEVPKGAQAELLITAARAPYTLDGLVMKDKNTVAGAAVLLIPQDLKHGRSIVRYQSDSDGSFSFTSLPAGRYTLLAIDDGRGLAYADPAVIGPYLANGQTVTLPLAKDATLEVEVQTRK